MTHYLLAALPCHHDQPHNVHYQWWTLSKLSIPRQSTQTVRILQSKLAFIPNVNFDFVVYTKELGPIVLSVKTSLRERYKQADLEGMMLRQVHRRSKSFLITMNEAEAASVSNKIENGEVLGLDKVIYAAAEGFNTLISELNTYNIIKPPKIDVITSSRLIE